MAGSDLTDRPDTDRPGIDRLGIDRCAVPDEAAPPSWLRHAGFRQGGFTAPPADDDQEIWLLSYSDMVTLLFSVFVMLLAITTLKDQLPKTPPPQATPPQAGETMPVPLIVPVVPVVEEDDRPRLNPGEVAVEAPEPLAERWRRRLEELGMPAEVAVQVRHNQVGIDIGAAILFASGHADLSAEGRAVLARLASTLAATPGDVVVEGHTDAVPIASARFPSNWELSAARAAAVVRALIEAGLPAGRLSAVGYADTRPLAEGTDPASLARNRRVTLTLQAEAGAMR